MTRNPGDSPRPDFSVWTETKIGQGKLRSVRNPFSGHPECCLFDFLAGHGLLPEEWHEWVRVIRASGFPVRIAVVGYRIEALIAHATLRHILDNYAPPSHWRRVAYMQLRRAEKAAHGNG
jgi:hypothetical protein